MKPALTAEEWNERYHRVGHGIGVSDDGGAVSVDLPDGKSLSFIPPHRHALAALALNQQPFGFSREDVKLLREIASAPYAGLWQEPAGKLADRIEALLPPE